MLKKLKKLYQNVHTRMIILYVIVFFLPIAVVFVSYSQKLLNNVSAISYFLGALIMIYWYKKVPQETIIETQKKDNSPVFAFLMGFGSILLSLIVQGIASLIEISLTGVTPTSQNTQNIIQMILQTPLLIIAATIGGPIMEEFIFRRALIGLLQPRTNFWVAAIVSSMVFSFVHLDGHYLVYFSIGFLFALIYKWSGRIWASMITHCGMNAFVVLVQIALAQGWLNVPS